jgi:hypothetical protein
VLNSQLVVFSTYFAPSISHVHGIDTRRVFPYHSAYSVQVWFPARNYAAAERSMFRSTRRPRSPIPDKNSACLASGGSTVAASLIPQIIRKAKAMRTLSLVLLLMASIAFVLLGCSDNSAVPVSPTNQSVLAPASLQKSPPPTTFTAKMWPTGIIGVPIKKTPDGKVKVMGIRQPVTVIAVYDGSPDLITGFGEVEINGISDYNTGVGQWYGKLTLTPNAGGVWEFTWHGTATLDLGTLKWTLPLKEEGHGKGGGLTGMQCRMENIITANFTLDSWTGAAQGVVISH